METKQICAECGRIFTSEDGFGICPECRNRNKPEEDDSLFDVVLVDGNEDDDYDEDPDYEMDDNEDDDDDGFELDLDEDLFNDDYE